MIPSSPRCGIRSADCIQSISRNPISLIPHNTDIVSADFSLQRYAKLFVPIILVLLMILFSFSLIALPAIASAFQVTTNGSSVQPSWSLDGTRLVYQSTTNGITNIWTINIDGTDKKQITNMPGLLNGINRNAWGPVYQPNSNQIYYMDNSTTGADYHWIVKTSTDGSTGRNPVMMVPGGHTFSAPKFSPDGSKFCYVHYNPYSTTKYSIKTANADGTNSQLILGDNNINYSWLHSVSWGRGINSDKLLYTKKVNGVVSFYVVKTNGTGETKITDSSIASGYDVDWSPDGTKIIFTGTDSLIYIMNSDGSNILKVTTDAYVNSQGEFSPDGFKIAYVSKRNGANDIYMVNLISAAPTTSTSVASSVTNTSAILNGNVNPNGSATTSWFEWGTTSSYGNTTSSQSITSGTSSISVTEPISGLSPGITYHFRVVAQNSAGTSYGSDQVFMTEDVGPWTLIGPDGGDIRGIVISSNYGTDQTLFVGTYGGGVFKSTDGGLTWTAVNTGLSNLNVFSLAISPNYSSDQTLFVGTLGGGVFKSTDRGITWTAVNTGLGNLVVNSIGISPNYVSDQTLFAGTSGGGVFKTTSGGMSWITLITGMSNLQVHAIALSPNYAIDKTLFAGTSSRVFKSTDGGTTWTASNWGVYSIALSPNYVIDQTLFAGTLGNGVFKSTNGGTTWTAVNTGLGNLNVFSLAISPNYVSNQTMFVGTWGGLFKSMNAGMSWSAAHTGLSRLHVRSIVLSPNYVTDQTLFAGTSGGGVFRSTDTGVTWTAANTGLNYLGVWSLSISPNYATDQTLFVGTYGVGVFKSMDRGMTWTAVNTGLGDLIVYSIVLSPKFVMDQTIFAGTAGGGVFKSTNGGTSWTAVNTGLGNLVVNSIGISPNYVSDQTLFAGTWGGLFKSADGGTTWTAVNTGFGVNSIVLSPKFVMDKTIFAGGSGGVFKSTDGGITWTAVNTGLGNLVVNSIGISPNYATDQTLFAGKFFDGVFKSTNGGMTWKDVNTGWNYLGLAVPTLATSMGYPCDGTLLVGTNGSSVWKYLDTEAMATCSPPPTITSITPSSAIAGTFDLTINGSNFDAGAVDQVYTPTGAFMGQGIIKSRTSSQIVVTESMGGTGTGNYTVKVKNSNGQESNGMTLTITSCSYTAGEGTSGLQLTAFQDAYSRAGGQSVLGCSQGVVRSTLASGAIGSTAIGLVQDFDKGHIHLINGSTIAFVTLGTIDTLYVDMGGTASHLGFPTSDPFITADGATRQDFEGGYMYTTLEGITSTVLIAKPTLIKLNNPSDYRVFYVSSSGTKYHIPDPETFEILGFDWAAIKAVPDTDFNNYTTGSGIPVLRTGSARDGSMVWRGTKDSIKVYIIENGILRHIPDPDTLYSMGRTFDEVIVLDAALFDRIPIGSAIPSSTDDSFINYVNGLGLSGIAGYDLDVNTAIGNYAFQKTDLAIPGRGLPVVFATAYNAMAPYNPKSPIDNYIMGPGWTHSYNMTATEVTKDGANLFVRVKWGDGHEEVYKWDGTAYKGFGVHNKVVGGGGSGTLTVTTRTQVRYSFTLDNSKTKSYPSTDKYGNQTTLTTNVYRLSNISDRNSNTTTLNYSGNLSSITDTVGRITSFTYMTMTNSSGTDITRLTKVADPIGRTVEFTYDADGKLISSKDLNGGATTFAYKQVQGLSTPLIVTITDPRWNPYVSNSYKDGITDTSYKKATSISIGGSGPSSISYSGSTASVKDPLAFTTTYTHDTSKRLTQVTDPLTKNIGLTYGDTSNPLDPTGVTDKRDYQTIFTYDSNGNVLTMTDPLGKVTNLEYDSMNNLTRKTDALGRVTTYTYDAKWNLTKISASIGTVNITNNTYGQPETVMDARGNTTLYVYDSQGNLTEVREPIGKMTKFVYDSVGRKTSETDANGNTTYFTYDNNNNLLTIKNALNQTVSYQYDTNGNRTVVIDENGNTTSYTFDARNTLTVITDPEGGIISYGYDELNRLKTITDASGKITKYEYDAIDNLTRVTDANSGTLTYTYDANGNRLSMTDPNGKATNYTYDSLNRLKTKTEPLGGIFEYFYDVVGNVDYMTGPRGTTDYEYDLMNRITKVTYPDYSTVSFAYDNNGNITSMTDGLGTTTYQYDALDRLTSYTDPFGKTVSYVYDSNNNRTSITYPDSKVVQYGYDTLNRLATVRDWLNRTATYSYDSASRLTGITNPNGTVSVYAYDKSDRLTALTNRKSSYDVISTYSYAMDAVGNPTSVNLTEPLLRSVSNQNITYTYDSENRLTSAGGVSYGYDSNGNLTSRGSSDNFSYDYRDKLSQSFISGVTTQYKYDGAGNRLAKIGGGTTKRYVLDINNELSNVIAETDGSGNITAYYVYGLGLLSKVLPDGTAFYYHYDSRGSTIALTDADGNITDAYAYDPFGKVVNSTGTTPNPFRYVGRYGLMDEGNGLTYVRARYYMPELGRFITKDPLTGEDRDGQSLHRYVYAINNPVRLVDVSGLSGEMPLWYRLTKWAEPTQQFITDMCRATAGIPEPMLRHYCAGFTIGSAITNTIRNTNDPSNLRKFANDIGVQIQGVGGKINNRISKKVFIQKGKPTITVNHSLLSPRGKKVFKKVAEFGVELAFDLVSPVQVMIIDPWSMIFYGNKGTQL